jgi:hypothetical protein
MQFVNLLTLTPPPAPLSAPAANRRTRYVGRSTQPRSLHAVATLSEGLYRCRRRCRLGRVSSNARCYESIQTKTDFVSTGSGRKLRVILVNKHQNDPLIHPVQRNAATFGDHQGVCKVSSRPEARGAAVPVRSGAQGSKVRFADNPHLSGRLPIQSVRRR